MRTTPEAIDLQRTFREMLDGGDQACAMEISSHALELRRADGIHVAVAVFTNLTQDHLDFHETMDDYFDAKRRLFASPLTDVRVANLDDPYGRRLADEFAGTVTFAIDAPADYRATGVRTGFAGTDCTFETPDGAFDVHVPLPGRFNVLNALGAWAAARALGAQPDVLAAALAGRRARARPVRAGRRGPAVRRARGLRAHARLAGERAARGARAGGRRRVIAVFGAGGDRDRGKRPLMGEIGARLADVCLVTSDNPRSEDPEAIIARDPRGRRRGAAHVEHDADRRASIHRAVALAQPGDVVVIAGKGHEQGQEFADGRKEPFDDVAVARGGAARREGLGRDTGRRGGRRAARAHGAGGGPERAVIDSREAGPGDLFVGLVGENADGGRFAAGALEAGAWGVLVAPSWAESSAGAARCSPPDDPLAALGALAREWRRSLGAAVIAVTGSVGKTSTKDLVAALIAPHRAVVASRANFNTDIGMPLEILAAPDGTEVLVLEAAMRGFGEIATLAAICEPDVGVITNIGPVHLEQVGSLEGVARAKGELLEGMRDGDHGGRPGRRAAARAVPAGRARGRPLRPTAATSSSTATPSSRAASGSTSSCRSRRATSASTRSPRSPPRGRSACVRRAAWRCGSGRCAASAWRSRAAPPSSTTATTPARLSVRAALDDLAAADAQRAPDRRARRHARARGRPRSSCTARSAPHAEAAGVDVLVTVGPRAVGDARRVRRRVVRGRRRGRGRRR